MPDSMRRLVRDAPPGQFSVAELDGMPDPVRRYLTRAIAVGTPLAQSAYLKMRGRIKVGMWMPFQAHELLSPHHGLIWAARAAAVISGSDRYVDGIGGSDWTLLTS